MYEFLSLEAIGQYGKFGSVPKDDLTDQELMDVAKVWLALGYNFNIVHLERNPWRNDPRTEQILHEAKSDPEKFSRRQLEDYRKLIDNIGNNRRTR